MSLHQSEHRDDLLPSLRSERVSLGPLEAGES